MVVLPRVSGSIEPILGGGGGGGVPGGGGFPGGGRLTVSPEVEVLAVVAGIPSEAAEGAGALVAAQTASVAIWRMP